jgi:hypothetical protein
MLNLAELWRIVNCCSSLRLARRQGPLSRPSWRGVGGHSAADHHIRLHHSVGRFGGMSKSVEGLRAHVFVGMLP